MILHAVLCSPLGISRSSLKLTNVRHFQSSYKNVNRRFAKSSEPSQAAKIFGNKKCLVFLSTDGGLLRLTSVPSSCHSVQHFMWSPSWSTKDTRLETSSNSTSATAGNADGSGICDAKGVRIPMTEVQETIVKAISSTRRKLDVTQSYTERNFITPIRALNDYLLKPSDLELLRKIQRRSPYDGAPPLTVYLRREVETKAMEVWGSLEALQRELKKKKEEQQKHRDNIFNVKKILKEYHRAERASQEAKRREMILKGSGRVVHTAVAINASNFAFKIVAWLYTGSHSMFAEAIHSLADTANQLILAFGIRKSIQDANPDHPYGYHNMRYVSSLISGVGIFFFGAGLAWYHGVKGIMNPEPMESFYWAYFILCGSLISEGGTLLVAFNEIKRGAMRENTTILEYVMRSRDPSVNVVLLEDLAAVLGVSIAASFMGITSYLGNPIFDAMGSLIIGGVLASVAAFIIYTNTVALVGRSIPVEMMQKINSELENDVMIRAIHDVKATDMGNSVVRYKAEIDFDGRELTRSYLDTQDLELLLEEMKSMATIEEVDAFMLKHGENIVDLLGAQVDRIESTLKKRHPEVRHVDLEVL